MRVGTDEAGKGPVLGSMFAAAVCADPGGLPPVDDSKRLAPARREELDGDIRATCDVGVGEVTVGEIDDPETDMNTLTVVAHARALDDLGVDGVGGLADAGDVDAERFARRVRERTERDVALDARHRADETDPVVAAASVVAKVARDAHVERLRDEYECDVGSGYPSDPTTREFLSGYVRREGALPGCARRSWQTSADVLAAAEQSALGDF